MQEKLAMPGATAAPLTGRNLIAGRWLPSNGARFESHSPSRVQEVLGVFPASTP